MTWTIGRKLLLAYICMSLLTILASGYAVYRLYDLTRKADYIVNRDVTLIERSRTLLSTLVAMEDAAKKYPILKDPEIANIYYTRSHKFDVLIDQLTIPSKNGHNEKESVIMRKRHLDKVFAKEEALVRDGNPAKAMEVAEREGGPIIDALVYILRTWEKRTDRWINQGIKEINLHSMEAMRITVILAGLSLLLGILLTIGITLNISRPLRKLEAATGHIGTGNFDARIEIEREDEIGHLARAFDIMTARLKELEARLLDASPLTRLPGNLAIEREIETRLKQGRPFSLCHIDLDNFKPFADVYGYAWGSEVIKETAAILEEAKRAEGTDDDFIGHIGGDDFVLLAEPERALRISRYMVSIFDERTRKYYTEEDRKRGSIMALDRKGELQELPLVTVTISIVTDDGTRFKRAVEMARIAAQVKKYGKRIPGNNCVTEEQMEEACKGEALA